MARNRKFSFALPRRSKNKVDDNDDIRSTPSIPSAHEWPSRREEPSSKAHRVLGTSEPMYHSTSGQNSVAASPGYRSGNISQASFGSQIDDRTSATDNGYPKRPGMSKRPSSNILGRSYHGSGRQGSDNSSVSHQVHPQTSNSTLRSHYDAKTSPLAISQQTSDSAVRDRALRRGQPPVLKEDGYNMHVASPMSPGMDENKKEYRRSKPARLDISKLFPKPRGSETHNYGNALLSPTKMVNSPAAMSMASEYFPRPMTREPTPQIGGQVKLKTTTRHQNSATQSPSSPVRKFKRDEYDSAKVHIRRPPRGVQHWFDALDEDSDEASEDAKIPIYAPKAVRSSGVPKGPARKASYDRGFTEAPTSHKVSRSQHMAPNSRHDTFTHEDLVEISRLTSPSQYSVGTENSLVSTRTKTSALSKSNLQDSSVLSFSSSEDEVDGGCTNAQNVAVRRSLDMGADAGEIVIGQAQAFEVRPHRRTSAGMMSTRSISTTAATIEVMYTPETPLYPSYNPRSSVYSGGRRSSHMRQPSVIPEDEDDRPKTSANLPHSPSTHSLTSERTSTSEPKPSSDGSHKLMAVTAEEEALLELMRKKRAAMAQQGAQHVERTATEHDKRQKSPTESSQRPYRTSAFLSLDSSPVRVVETKPTRKLSPSPLQVPPRGRPIRASHESNVARNQFRDSSASDSWSDRNHSPASRDRLPHYLPTPSVFSPLELFPPASPTLTTSIASPTTIDHASPLPSPITPGLRMTDVTVRVASSDTSNDSEEVAILDNGVIEAPRDSIKSESTTHEITSRHQRRRTASSGADEIKFPAPPSNSVRDSSPMTEAPSRQPSTIEVSFPKPPRSNSWRMDAVPSLSTPARSRQNSVHSTNSRNSSYSHVSNFHHGMEKRNSRLVSRGSVISNASAKDSRNSVNDDILAAWNSLGGT